MQVFDTRGKLIGTVSLTITKNGYRATSFDFPREYGLKFVKKKTTTVCKPEVEEEHWYVPEEAGNEY